MATVRMNLQQLWFLAKGLDNIKPVKIPAQNGKEISKTRLLVENLFAVDGC